MGRTTTPTVQPETDIELNPEVASSQTLLNSMQQQYGDERDLVNQLLGQAQMADAFAKFSVTVTTSKLAYVKENKLYRALNGKDSGNGYQFSGTWDEFCGLLGISREKADLDISNLKTFGEEALESMSRMGIGYRELRQYRRLPDDQKQALIEVAKTGDKEGFVELAEEIITKHAKEKAALTQQLEDAEADLQAREEVLAGRNTKIDQLETELSKAKKLIATMPPEEEGAAIRAEAGQIAFECEALLMGKMRPAIERLNRHTMEHDHDHEEFKAGLICQLELLLNQLRSDYGIKSTPNADPVPAWAKEE